MCDDDTEDIYGVFVDKLQNLIAGGGVSRTRAQFATPERPQVSFSGYYPTLLGSNNTYLTNLCCHTGISPTKPAKPDDVSPAAYSPAQVSTMIRFFRDSQAEMSIPSHDSLPFTRDHDPNPVPLVR